MNLTWTYSLSSHSCEKINHSAVNNQYFSSNVYRVRFKCLVKTNLRPCGRGLEDSSFCTHVWQLARGEKCMYIIAEMDLSWVRSPSFLSILYIYFLFFCLFSPRQKPLWYRSYVSPSVVLFFRREIEGVKIEEKRGEDVEWVMENKATVGLVGWGELWEMKRKKVTKNERKASCLNKRRET